MKKISLQNKILALFVLFLVLAIFIAPIRQIVIKAIMAVSRPFLSLNQMDCKDSLPEILTCPSFSLQLVPIISRPPQSPYDILIIGAGSENGIKTGMLVMAQDNVLLGHVAEVFPAASKIKLISFSEEETNVLIESAGNGTSTALSAIAIGRGGENLEIKLPSAIEIKSGAQVMTMGTFPLAVGVVEKVEINLSDPFQKIFFRLPVNIQELKYVMIEK
jgi:cell shape-determining protein MreC